MYDDDEDEDEYGQTEDERDQEEINLRHENDPGQCEGRQCDPDDPFWGHTDQLIPPTPEESNFIAELKWRHSAVAHVSPIALLQLVKDIQDRRLVQGPKCCKTTSR